MIKILLDPGHGQGSAHNRGYIGGNEGDSNYAFSLVLAEELKKYGMTVGTTRSKPSDNPSLETRGKMAKGYDLFLSLHSNAGGGRGAEVYDDVNTRNTALATKICEVIATTLGIPNRGVKYRYSGGGNYYGVLRTNLAKSDMLIEFFFHDNSGEVDLWKARNKLVATNLAKAIAEHYGVVKASSSAKLEGEKKLMNYVISLQNIADIEGASIISKKYLAPIFMYDTFVGNKEMNWDKFKAQGIKIIGIGGSKGNHTGYLDCFIGGKNRGETLKLCKEFKI